MKVVLKVKLATTIALWLRLLPAVLLNLDQREV